MEKDDRIIFEEDAAIDEIITAFQKGLHNKKKKQSLVLLCIGSDLSIFDSLGPLIGTKLMERSYTGTVYGTLSKPVHANNLEETIDLIYKENKNPFIVAIDASFGKKLNRISIIEGPIQPGAGCGKLHLPSIGDLSIIVTTATNGPFSQFKCRLGEVYELAEKLSFILCSSI